MGQDLIEYQDFYNHNFKHQHPFFYQPMDLNKKFFDESNNDLVELCERYITSKYKMALREDNRYRISQLSYSEYIYFLYYILTKENVTFEVLQQILEFDFESELIFETITPILSEESYKFHQRNKLAEVNFCIDYLHNIETYLIENENIENGNTHFFKINDAIVHDSGYDLEEVSLKWLLVISIAHLRCSLITFYSQSHFGYDGNELALTYPFIMDNEYKKKLSSLLDAFYEDSLNIKSENYGNEFVNYFFNFYKERNLNDFQKIKLLEVFYSKNDKKKIKKDFLSIFNFAFRLNWFSISYKEKYSKASRGIVFSETFSRLFWQIDGFSEKTILRLYNEIDNEDLDNEDLDNEDLDKKEFIYEIPDCIKTNELLKLYMTEK